ncbi:MAG: preprotein translocase subunit SecD, partial [Halobaculum sp.]
MSLYGTLRDNWRVGLLTVLVVLSTVFLFAPGFAEVSSPAGETAAAGPTNLKYGLQLDGGTRIRAPLVGVTAEGVEFGQPNESVDSLEATVARDVAGQLPNADVTDVIVRTQSQTEEGTLVGTVEVTVDNVTTDQLGSAVTAAGYGSPETVRQGVTETTRQQTVRVLQSKINEAGLSGGTVQTVRTLGGQPFVLVEVPNADRSEVIELVNSKGSVRVVGYHPVQRNNSTVYVNTTLITQDQFLRISNAQEETSRLPPRVPVRVTEAAAPQVQENFRRAGLAQNGGTRCTFQTAPNSTEPCILVVSDGSVIGAYGIEDSLSDSLRNGEWASDPSFFLQTQSFSEAQEVAVDLRAGALPAPLDVGAGGSGTVSFVSPAQGQDFKRSSLLTGIIAVLAVSGVVFLRYGSPEVALPMIVTALAEVYALLGFAALLQFPLDLSVIGGFIAVIGTGVDDLIIIADEVMSEGEVNSRRVFQSRFRKAFWVIGAAAATTVIAMSPLAVLSLGDLQGFAIFTILGVLVGVLITRPAYGDILRALLTDK